MAESETGRGLRLLSLDGGGIRGLSELLIIEEIMKRIQNQSNLQHVPRPAEYFDLIGGTSTGGLIAILLGRLGLSAGEAIEVYTRLAGRIFSERKWKFQDGTFKSTILEEEMKKIVEEKLGPDQADAKMLEDEGQGQGCKMFVCATPALNVAFRRRFRNYRVRRHEAYNCTIWEAGRATSAAPTFFKRIEIGGEQFVDAGLGCNNPIKEVISEAQLAFGKERKVDCIISVGTGKAGVIAFDKPTGFQKILPLDLLGVLRKMATESSNTAEEMKQRYEGVADCYFRLDVDQGLQDVGLDEWKHLGAVKTHTIAYTMETNVNRKIDAVIRLLTGADSPDAYNLAQLGGQIFSTKGGSLSAKDRRLEPIFNVPFLRDLDFVDRADIMTQISKSFLYPGARVALLGLGGIGKSQLAIEYAHRVRDSFPQTWVFWVHATNQARMEEDFEQIAGILDLPSRDDPETNILQIVGQWLRDTSEKWLLVVDNADDPTMFSNPARDEQAKEEKAKGNPRLLNFPPLVTPHLPHTQNGSILVTSRNEEAALALVGEDQNIIHVGEMNEKESLDLLLKKLNKSVDPQGASDLVKALDYFPLAITQAAAFLSRRKGRVSISQYAKDVNKSNEKIIHLLKPEFINPRRDLSAVNSTIATWQISFNHIQENWPSAAETLSLMSFFNCDGVPEFLLHDSGGSALSGSINEDVDEDFEKRLRILKDYCLISIGEDSNTFRMHRLVQAATQDWLKSDGSHQKMWRKCLQIVSEAFPANVYDNWERCRQLLPHIEYLGSQQPIYQDSAEDWARILSKVNDYKRVLAKDGEAPQTSNDALSDTAESVVSEEIAFSERTGSSQTLIGTVDRQMIARTLADQLVQKSELEPLYRKAFKDFDEERFRRNHDRLLKGLFADLRNQCGNDSSRRTTVRLLGRQTQRALLTDEISTLSAPNRIFRRRLQGLENIKLDSRNRINSMLKEGDKSVQRSFEPENSERPERESDIQKDNPAEDDNNDSDLDSGSSDDEIAEEDEQKMEPMDSMLDFLFSGDPFNRYRSRLYQFLFPPTSLVGALQYGNKQAVKRLIERDFDTVREKFSLLDHLERDGHSPSRIAEILCSDTETNGFNNFEASESFFLDHSTDPELRKKDTTRLQLQVLRSSIRRLVCSIPAHRIWFTGEDDVGHLTWSNQLKLLVEDLTDANWLWWPLSPPMKRLGPNKSRLNWICNCGKHVWEDITIDEAALIQDLLQKRVGTPSRSIYCRRGSTNRSLMSSIWESIRQLIGGPPTVNQSPLPRAHILGWCRERIYSLVRSDWGKSSPIIPMHELNDIQSSSYTSVTSGQEEREKRLLWVLLGIPKSGPLMEAAEIEIDMKDERCDWKFYRSLRNRYREKRGLLRLWLSVWQIKYCDFVEFKVVRPQKLAHRSKSLPSDLQYDYQPRPPLVPSDTAREAPISPDEFEEHFSACDGNCSWPIFHGCIQPSSGNSDVRCIPKKKSAFDLDSKQKPKLWGLQVVYARSGIRMAIFYVLFLVGPFGFWAFWQAHHPDEASNAVVPASVVIALISCFWTYCGAAEGFKRPEST